MNADSFMNQIQNEPAHTAVRVGIVERLKAETLPEPIVALVSEFKTYADASAKTSRRFLRVLMTKGIPAKELDCQFLRRALP